MSCCFCHPRWLWLALVLIFAAGSDARADGMVVPEEFYPKVEIPNQQAMITLSNGVERLVIETAFLGEGTNFAWVVPLPSPPQISAVSGEIFPALRRAFTPRLIHQVSPYYAAVLFVCGLLFLGMRAMRDEVTWVVDVPLCLVLAVLAGLLGRHYFFGLLAAALAFYVRLLARTPASLALALITGIGFSLALTVLPRTHGFDGLVQTMGGEGGLGPGSVEVVSVQHVGVFESTTIRGTSAQAILRWLEGNHYRVPPAAEPAVRYYHDRGWVFVATRVRRHQDSPNYSVLHPLQFAFSTPSPVYPTRLTALDNQNCRMDLYVFGQGRAAARHFNLVRCDLLATSPQALKKPSPVSLRLGDPELGALVGDATVGTKLSGTLSPAQMAGEDVEIQTTRYRSSGGTVYSRWGAFNIALNGAVPLGAIGWLLLGSARGGWEVHETNVKRWRMGLMMLSLVLGVAAFLWLPKTEVEIRPGSAYHMVE